MTREVTDQLYIELGYYEPEEYYVYTAEAESQQAVESSMSASVGVIRQGDSQLSAEFSQIATISNIRGADLFAFSDALLSTQVDRIRDYNIESSAQFDIATDGRVFRDITSAETSLFDLALDAERSRDIQSETQAAFSFDCEATVITANINGEANLLSEFTASASGDRIRFIEDTLSSEASLTATISHIEGADIVLLPFAEIAVIGTVTRNGILQADSNFTLSSSVSKLTLASFQLDSRFVLFASRYTGSGRPKHLTSLTPLIFSTTAKFGSHSLQSGKSTFLYENTPPRPGQDWVIEGWAYQRFSSRTQINSWSLSTDWGRVSLTQTANSPTINLNAVVFDENNEVDSTVSNLNIDVYVTTGAWVHIAYVQSGPTRSVYINGTRRATGPAAADYRKDSFNSIIVGDTSSSNWLIDEASVRVGDTYGYDAANSSITVPTEPRVNDPVTTQFLYHFNNEALDDIIIPTETSVISANALASITATLSGPQRLDPLSLNSAATLTAVGVKTREIILTAFDDAELTAIIGYRQFGSSDLSTDTDITIVPINIAGISLTLENSIVQTVDAVITASASADFQALASQLSVVVKTAEGIVFQEILSSLSAEVNKTTGYESSILSDSQLTVEYIKIRDLSATLTVDSQLAVIATSEIGLEAALSSTTEVSATALRIQPGVIATEAIFSQMTVVAAIAEGIVFQEIVSTMTIEAVKTSGTSAAVAVDSSFTIEPVRLRDNNSQTLSTASQTAEVNYTARGSAALSAEFQQTTVGVKDTDIVMVAFSDGTLIAVTTSVVSPTLEFTSSSSLTVGATPIVRSGAADLTFDANLLNIITVDYSLIIDLEANTSVSANLNVLHLDLHVYRIPNENRQFVIDREQREFSISSETRTFKVRR